MQQIRSIKERKSHKQKIINPKQIQKHRYQVKAKKFNKWVKKTEKLKLKLLNPSEQHHHQGRRAAFGQLRSEMRKERAAKRTEIQIENY